MKATWNGKVIAESNDIVEVEGNAYFPLSSIHRDYFKDSSTHTTCPWKGRASYFVIDVDGNVNVDDKVACPAFPRTGGVGRAVLEVVAVD